MILEEAASMQLSDQRELIQRKKTLQNYFDVHRFKHLDHNLLENSIETGVA